MKFRIIAGREPEPAPRRNDRFAVTKGNDEFAVARDVRGSRPMGIVADLGNVYCGTLQGCTVAVNRVDSTLQYPSSSPGARILFPTPPTCGIIPPHRGSVGIRFRQMGRIQ